MKFVVDTNIIFSLFKASSFTTELIKEFDVELIAPRKLLDELFNYSELICSKAGLTKEQFKDKISLLPEIIEFKTPSRASEEEASKLISHKTDIPFLALALELKIPIWSNDSHFKGQDFVKVFNTEELKEFLDLI